MFNTFIVKYQNFFQYSIPITGLLFIKSVVMIDTNIIILLCKIILPLYLIFKCNSVKLFTFKIYLFIKELDKMLDETCLTWVKNKVNSIIINTNKQKYVNKTLFSRSFSTSARATNNVSVKTVAKVKAKSKFIKYRTTEYVLPKDNILTDYLVYTVISQFRNDVFDPIFNNNIEQHIQLFIKFNYENGEHYTLLSMKYLSACGL